jgi:hypothetical protein
VFAGIPEAPADAAGPVSQFELQVKVAVAVGPQLLVGYEKYFFEVLAIVQLINKAPAHVSCLPAVIEVVHAVGVRGRESFVAASRGGCLNGTVHAPSWQETRL